MLIGMVSDTFAIKGRGVVVATDTTYEQLPQDLKLKVGDPIELRRNGAVILRTNVGGIEHCDPWTPKQPFGFLLPREVSKEDVPVGAEVWTIESLLNNWLLGSFSGSFEPEALAVRSPFGP